MVEALTRSDVQRGVALTDDELIRGLLGPQSAEPDRIGLLVAVARLLRAMDGLIRGAETGEGFVAKFSDRFLAVTEWDSDPNLSAVFERVNEFYSEIQTFSQSASERAREPLLMNCDELKDRTQIAYGILKDSWRRAITGPTGSSGASPNL
jgi:hypothetical protein